MDLLKAFQESQMAIGHESYGEKCDACYDMLEAAQKLLPKVREEKTYPNWAIRGGNSGILLQGNIVGNGHQSCPIKAFLRSWNVEEKLDSRALYTFSVGTAQESVFAKLHPDFKMGVLPNEEGMAVDGIPIRAEVDAVAPDGTFYELKSVASTKKLKPYFVSGEYSFDNLVQLAFYMAVFLQPKGVLKYTAAVYHDTTIDKVAYKFVPGFTREYAVHYNEQGRFYVDNKPTMVTTDSIYRHVEYIAYVFNNLPRVDEILVPVSSEDPTKSVCCVYCPFKEVCQHCRDNKCSLEELKMFAEEVVK
jgi:hypothetical protein